MRLLQAMAGAEVGGAEAFFVRLAIAFADAGINQRVIIRRDSFRARALRNGGLDPMELPFGGRMDFRTRPALQREIDRYKPDIVLTWMSRATWATPKSESRDGYKLIARLGGYYDLKYYRHCDYLIGNTEDIVEHIVSQGFCRDRIVYLPNFVHPPKRAKASRIGFDTPLDVPLLLAMGRLHENKGFDVLLRALAELSETWLWIAGEGSEAGALSRLANELGVADRVRFLGWRDDPDALMQACNIFVCSSRHEPLGNIILEAWAAEKPVVAAAAAGPKSLIGDDAAGIMVPVDNPGALAAGVRSLIADPGNAARLAVEGHRRYQANYTEAAVVAQYRQFFERVA